MSQATPGPSPDEVSVSVVIVTYQSATVLAGCLASLAVGLEGVPRWEAIVVDNASEDGSADLVEQLMPAAKVVRLHHNAGYAAGLNAGIAAADAGTALLALNPDVRLLPGAVRHLASALAVPGCGIAVPRIADGEGVLQYSLRREPTVLRAFGEALLGGHRSGRFAPFGEIVGAPSGYETPGTADWATGAVMLVSRACLEAVASRRPDGQPWDTSFFLYSEETEFCLQARDLGFGLRYVPTARVEHLGGESNTSPRLWSLLTLNRLALYRRRHGRCRSAAFSSAVFLNEALRSARAPTHRAAVRSLVAGKRPPLPTINRLDAAPDYVCFSAQDWWYHNQAHSDFQLMRGIARSRKVLFVNSIGMRMPLPGRSTMFVRRILRKARSMTRLLQRPLPDLANFWVFTPVTVPLYGRSTGRTINTALVWVQVALAARRIGIRTPVIVVTIPTAWEVARRMPHRSLIFNRSDKHSAFTETNQPYIRRMEGALLRHADKILYVSRALMAEEASSTDDRAVFLDHGVDLEHFKPRPAGEEPADLRAIPHPRVGFFGGFDDYIIDFDVLERLAREIPEAHLVLIGDATCSMRRFDELANVHWLGYRPYADIPRYGSGFDVALMPWLDNEWIKHSNPIKLKEYLALGLPVVSTDFPEVHHYESVVRIAKNDIDFVAMVSEALLESAGATSSDIDAVRAERRSIVAGASWESRAARVIECAEGDQ